MTTQEAGKKISDLHREMEQIHARIAQAARAIVPVLLDSGQANSAKVLQELFFELDAKIQEMGEFTRGNIDALVALLTAGRSGA